MPQIKSRNVSQRITFLFKLSCFIVTLHEAAEMLLLLLICFNASWGIGFLYRRRGSQILVCQKSLVALCIDQLFTRHLLALCLRQARLVCLTHSLSGICIWDCLVLTSLAESVEILYNLSDPPPKHLDRCPLLILSLSYLNHQLPTLVNKLKILEQLNYLLVVFYCFYKVLHMGKDLAVVLNTTLSHQVREQLLESLVFLLLGLVLIELILDLSLHLVQVLFNLEHGYLLLRNLSLLFLQLLF